MDALNEARANIAHSQNQPTWEQGTYYAVLGLAQAIVAVAEQLIEINDDGLLVDAEVTRAEQMHEDPTEYDLRSQHEKDMQDIIDIARKKGVTIDTKYIEKYRAERNGE